MEGDLIFFNLVKKWSKGANYEYFRGENVWIKEKRDLFEALGQVD